MKKVFFGLAVLFGVSIVSAQSYYPNFAYPQGYIMQEGNQAQQQNIASMSNWWGTKRGKITDTCPQTMTSARWGADSLACYCVANYSGTIKTLSFLPDNNRTDTGKVSIPANGETQKLPRIWKIVGTGNTSQTFDSLTLFFQNIKKLSNEF